MHIIGTVMALTMGTESQGKFAIDVSEEKNLVMATM